MASWGDFASARPDMADVFLKIMDWIPIAYLATVRRDGSPRVHPIVPIIGGGRVFVAVPSWSPKRHDLRRDGRFALHALPGKWRPSPKFDGQQAGDDEFYATGRATLVEDEATRALVAETAKHEIRSDDWIFELGMDRVMTAYWENVGQPGTYAVREFWHASK